MRSQQIVPADWWWREDRCYHCNCELCKHEREKVDFPPSELFATRSSFMVVHHEVRNVRTELVSATEQEGTVVHLLDRQLNLVNRLYAIKEWEYELQVQSLDAQLQHAVAQQSEDSVVESLLNAFADVRKGLVTLRDFSVVNRMAFTMILDKFDKTTGRNAAPVYMNAVINSYFSSSSKVIHLMAKVEDVFERHRRPKPSQQTERMTFTLGLAGCCLGLLVALMLLLLLPRTSSCHFSETFPPLSTLILVVLHLCIYGCNLFCWQQSQIDYASMLEHRSGADLSCRQVLFLSFILETVLIATMLSSLLADYVNFPIHDYVPPLTILAFVAFLLFPKNVFYKSARYSFLHSNFRIFGSPFFKAVFSDFFLADQLTSQTSGLKVLGYSCCYYGTRYLTQNTQVCSRNGYQYTLQLLPLWWRLLQCLRKFFDERDRLQLLNGGKYLSGMLAVATKLAYLKFRSTAWMAMFVTMSSCTTVYQLYWDIVMDWGLLQRTSRNPWLRDQLILKRKSMYFVPMFMNLLLRFAWLHSFLFLQLGGTDQMVVEFGFSALEVLRRGIWNFYRLNFSGWKMSSAFQIEKSRFKGRFNSLQSIFAS